MGLKTVRTSIRLDKEDIDFLKEAGVFGNTSEGVRWCIKYSRLYGPQVLKVKEIKEKIDREGCR